MRTDRSLHAFARRLTRLARPATLGALILAACARPEPPAPPPLVPAAPVLTRSKEALALIFDNRDRCLATARRAVQWFRINTVEGKPDKTFEKYITTEAAPDLAAARAVGVEIFRLIGAAKSAHESTEAVRKLEALYAVEQRICATDSWLGFDIESYERGIARAVYDFDKSATELSVYLEVAPAEYEQVVASYRPLVTRTRAAKQAEVAARIEAEHWAELDDNGPARNLSPAEASRKQREWADFQRREAVRLAEKQQVVDRWETDRESRPAEPLPKVGRHLAVPASAPLFEDQLAAMRTWHARVAPRFAALRVAVTLLADGRRHDVGAAHLASYCVELATTIASLQADNESMAVPDAELFQPLAFAVGEIGAGAKACLAGRSAEGMAQIDRGATALDLLAKAMAKYSLQL